MSLSSYLIRPEKGDTPQSVARRRALAAQLMGFGSAKNVGEGLGHLATGIAAGILNRRADAAERAGQASARGALSNLFAGGGYFPPAPSSGDVSSVSPQVDPISQRVAQAHGAAEATGETPWLSYANQGATRNLPLAGNLVNAMSFLPELGVSMEVFSGGQPEKGKGPRVGSTRHDHGNAADVFFMKDGRRLNWANEADRPIFEEIVRRGKAAGVTGFGAGDGYMQPGSMHIGFGNPGVWGAGGRGANAPDWLRNAYAGNAGPTQGAGMAALVNRPAVAPPVQLAQAGGMPEMAGNAPPVQSGGAPSLQQLMQAASNPWLTESERGVINMMLKQQMEANDPANALDIEYKRAQIDALRRRGGSLINAGNGNIYDPQTGQWITAPASENDGLFDGKSVQAQGLNYLIRTGKLTQEQAAQLAAGKTITDPSTGAITFMTPQGLVTQPAGASPDGGNITLTGPKKPTDTEAVTSLYADRMATSGGTIDELENAGLSLTDNLASKLPLGNYMVGDDYQRFDQAQRDFINAVLRRESGAVISDEEFDNARRQYLPQPGDSPDVLTQKRRNRQIAIQGMQRAAGPSYASPGAGGADNDPLGIR